MGVWRRFGGCANTPCTAAALARRHCQYLRLAVSLHLPCWKELPCTLLTRPSSASHVAIKQTNVLRRSDDSDETQTTLRNSTVACQSIDFEWFDNHSDIWGWYICGVIFTFWWFWHGKKIERHHTHTWRLLTIVPGIHTLCLCCVLLLCCCVWRGFARGVSASVLFGHLLCKREHHCGDRQP